jgi:hypothetical protein
VSAEGDAQRTGFTGPDRYPEVIDVGRNTVDLRGEGYWFARNLDEVARFRTELGMVSAVTMSVWQAAL